MTVAPDQTNTERLARVIFLISQPRSGSTLLQRILAGHPDVATAAEPWLALHGLYALKSSGFRAEYGVETARAAVEAFLEALPGGGDEYCEALRRMYGYLYGRALAGSGKRYFLDKTPRYYFIFKELIRVCTGAHFIVLFRNPLAVLCSIIQRWTDHKSFLPLISHRGDLLTAPRLLVAGTRLLGERAIVVHYERLINDPQRVVAGICERLTLAFSPSMIEYGKGVLPRWSYGDQDVVYEETRPAVEYAERWRDMLVHPHVWRLADDYLEALGPTLLCEMGYHYGELRETLNSHRPSRRRLIFAIPLRWWVDPQGRPAIYAGSIHRVLRTVRDGTSRAIAVQKRRMRRQVGKAVRWCRTQLG